MKLIDCFMFFNEQALLEQRINALNEVVDIFLIIEFEETFSGEKKGRLIDLSSFDDITKEKIKYLYVDAVMIETLKHGLAKTNFDRPLAWKHGERPANILHKSNKREIRQRDMLAYMIDEHANEQDLIIISDLDEIPDPTTLRSYSSFLSGNTEFLYYLEMDWRIFFSDLQCLDPWYGSYITKKNVFRNYSVDELRVSSKIQGNPEGMIIQNGGVHLSYLGGILSIRRKLNALGNQGLRVKLSKVIVDCFPWLALQLLRKGVDLLFQGRKLRILNNPQIHYVADNFIDKNSIYTCIKNG